MTTASAPAGQPRQRVVLFGASGTIGRAVCRALIADGHDVTCILRTGSSKSDTQVSGDFPGATLRICDVTDAASVQRDAFGPDRYDVVISCLASRSGVQADAWLVDHRANSNVLEASLASGVRQFILLSAICVQKPRLAFQHAKLAFERELVASGLTWSIVRPTAFFKSLSGQVERVTRGKPYLVFGDGKLTRCKPISDDDLGHYISGCITNSSRHHRILPIGGPGPAITPLDQGEALFALLGKSPHYRHVPVGFLDLIIGLLSLAGKVSRRAAEKAEYARIGRYYATESMLLLDPQSGSYSEAATPETGNETLFDHYAELVNSLPRAE